MIVSHYNVLDKNDDLVNFIQLNSREHYSGKIFKWQYSDEHSNICIIQEEKNILGTQGMITSYLKFKQHSILSHKSETTFIHESLRGKGQFELLYKTSVDNAMKHDSKIIWGFTALGNLWEKKLKFNCDRNLISESNLIIGFNDINRSKKKIYYFIKSTFTFVKLKLNSKPRLTAEEQVITELKDFEQFNYVTSDIGVSIDYNSKHTYNRIIKSPLIKYKLLKFKLENKTEALILFHIKNNELLISEFLYHSEQFITDIIKLIYQFGRKNKVTNIRFWANQKNPFYKKVFDKIEMVGGKTYSVTDMQFVYKINDVDLEDLALSGYFINGLWTEGFTY